MSANKAPTQRAAGLQNSQSPAMTEWPSRQSARGDFRLFILDLPLVTLRISSLPCFSLGSGILECWNNGVMQCRELLLIVGSHDQFQHSNFPSFQRPISSAPPPAASVAGALVLPGRSELAARPFAVGALVPAFVALESGRRSRRHRPSLRQRLRPAPTPAWPVALPITAPRLAPAPVPMIAPFSVVVSDDSPQPRKTVNKEMTKMVARGRFISSFICIRNSNISPSER